MRPIRVVLLTLMIAVSSLHAALAVEPDVKGSKDHPLLSRMPSFHITEYKTFDFDSYRFNHQETKYATVEGRKFYIEYKLNKGATEPGELKIRRNIQDALKQVGGTVVFDDNFNKCSTIVVQQEGKEVWVEVKSYNNMYRLTTVEKKAMEQEVVATAEKVGSDIRATGHAAIYGIYFDTAKATIKPESTRAIEEVAKLLKIDATLKVYVVGHTDNVGGVESNLKLSQERAEAVVQELIRTHGIAAARLKSHGCGLFAPVTSNDSEDGRAKNRRVELVKQ